METKHTTEQLEAIRQAAPELLEACQELIDGMIKGEKHNTANVTLYAIQMVKLAIAKATGKTP